MLEHIPEIEAGTSRKALEKNLASTGRSKIKFKPSGDNYVTFKTTPFEMINPCGYQGLKVTQLKDLNLELTMADVQTQILQQLMAQLSIKDYQFKDSF